MASLIDNLVQILNNENDEYQKLLEISQGKTDVIVRGDLDNLTRITDKEQEIVDKINSLENARIKTMKDIARILGTDASGLKLDNLIDLLAKTPKEQAALSAVHDKLHVTLHAMKLINERNAQLLKEAMEMVDFNMNLIQSMHKAPETANYGRGAYSTGVTLGETSGRFDAKQ